MIRPRFAVPLLVLAAFAFAPPARADLNERLGALTGANARGYLSPLPKALSTTMNAAIFTTGRVPKSGFDLSLGVRAMGARFDDADRTFTPVDPPGFTSTSPTPVSTIVGGTTSVSVPGQGGTSYAFPGGLDLQQFAFAAPELSIGSLFGTRAVVRWISTDLNDSDFGKVELFGIGAQHSLSRYLPNVPVDLALGVFYQTFKIGDGLLDTKAVHVDVTGSRSFGRVISLQPYAAIGYDTFDMDVAYTSTSNPADHISVTMDRQSNAHFTAGAVLRFPGVRLNLEANQAARFGAAVGLSVGN